MSLLSDVIDTVRTRIARYKGKDVGEQNTKTALIEPVLRALGWDVGDLEEVRQEYKRRPRTLKRASDAFTRHLISR